MVPQSPNTVKQIPCSDKTKLQKDTTCPKRVRFASHTVVAYLPNRPDTAEDEKCSTWWSLDDFHSMATDASQWAEESRRSKALIDSLDHALREARRGALQQNSQILSEYQTLRLWCQYGHSRRGLERAASTLHEVTRSNIINLVRKRVVHLSHAGADTDEIRRASEKASRSSVMFAILIGKADAEASLNPFPAPSRKLSTTVAIGSCSFKSQVAIKLKI